jgi:hypothetical protein
MEDVLWAMKPVPLAHGLAICTQPMEAYTVSGLKHYGEVRHAVIIKELDPYSPGDRFEKAGREAEEQMAFYLRRAFKQDQKIRVLNGVRLVRDGEVAQMDHLILHKFGFIIVESKSVTSEVRVDQHGAWTRVYKGTEHGMKSPVIQAHMQADILSRILEDHCVELLGKLLGLKKHFGGFPMDVLVAISDGGVLKRAAEVAPEACKADQVADRVLELIAHYRKLANPFTPAFKVAISFADGDIERITSFLLAHHTPFRHSETAQIEATVSTEAANLRADTLPAENVDQHMVPDSQIPEDETADSPAFAQKTRSVGNGGNRVAGTDCGKCGSSNLKLEYRFNFFLRCADCKAATPLVLHCSRCGTDHKDIKKPDTFKDNGVWSIKCAQCGKSVSVEVPQVGTAATGTAAAGSR